MPYNLIAILILASLLPACGRGCVGGATRIKDVSVVVEKVRILERPSTATIVGNIIPNETTVISYPYDVKVQEFYVNQGAFVKEGAPLFKISEEEISLNLSALKAKRDEISKSIEKMSLLLREKEAETEEGKTDHDKTTRLKEETESGGEGAELERINSEISRLTSQLEHTTTFSPISGWVTERREKGELVKAGEPIVKLVNVVPAKVSFSIQGRWLERFKLGSTISMFINELGEVHEGRVVYVGPEMTGPNKQTTVLVEIPNENMRLKAGMTASLEMEEGATRTYLIPTSAVMSKMRGPYVFVVKGTVAYKTPVVIGAINGDDTEIVEGLNEDDLVVVQGGDRLYHGATVNILR